MTIDKWKAGRVSDFFLLQRGFDITAINAVDGKTPVYSSSGFAYYHNEAKVKGPGVVTGRKGKVGRVYYIEEDFWPHDTTLWVKDFKGNNPKYIKYFIETLKLERYDEASSVPTLNRNNVHKIKCIFPPTSQQKEIVLIIETWAAAIEKAERLIAVKETRFSWLIESLIKDQCNGWPHLKAKKIFNSISEKNYPNEPLLSVTQDRGVIPRDMLEGRVMSPEGSTGTYKLIQKGNFVISLRSFQGGIEYSNYRGIISPAYTVLRRKIAIDDDFFRHFFKTRLFISKYLRIAVIGIRDGKQISIPDFMTIKIPCPPIEEQKRIASILNAARHEIDLHKKQLAALQKQKRGLMQKLLTGKIRLKGEN